MSDQPEGKYFLKDLSAGTAVLIEVDDIPFRIGRLPDNHCVIEDRSVSKHHAEIDLVDNQFVIRDLNSKNHTFVNGDAVTEGVVSPGDCVRFGKKMFHFLWGHREKPEYELSGSEFEDKVSRLKRTYRDWESETLAAGEGAGPAEASIVDEIGELERMHLQLGTLLEISNVLSSSLDIDEIMDNILTQLRRVVPAEKIVILVRGKKGFEPRIASGKVDTGDTFSSTIIGRVIKERRYALYGNACESDELRDAKSIIEHNIKSILCVPVSFQDELLGLIYLDNSSLCYSFNEKDAQLVSAVAAQAGIAFQNALLLEKINDQHARTLEIERLAAIGTFAAEISHQMKNSLVPLQKLERLKDLVGGDEEALQLVNSLSRSAERFEEINDGIRRLACPNKINPAPVDIALLIQQVLFDCKSRLNEKQIRVVKEIPAGEEIFVDHVQIEQALANIIYNAVEAIEKSAGEIVVRAEKTPEHWTISIEDNGPGIPGDRLDDIFKLFYSTKSGKGGNGMGLSLVRAVILAHQGEIEVESEPGRGAKFIITLPGAPPPAR